MDWTEWVTERRNGAGLENKQIRALVVEELDRLEGREEVIGVHNLSDNIVLRQIKVCATKWEAQFSQ